MAEWLPLIERYGWPTFFFILTMTALLKGWIYTRRHFLDMKADRDYHKARADSKDELLMKALSRKVRP